MENIHCSKLPSFFKCASFLMEPKVRVDRHSGPAAALGHAVHELMAQCVKDGTVGSIPDCADKYNVDIDEVAFLWRNGSKAWSELANLFSLPTAEIHMKDPPLEGTADIMCLENGVILDWKTGYVEADYEKQLLGYATLMSRDFEGDVITTIIVWLRYGTYEVKKYSSVGIVEFEQELKEQIEKIGKEFKPGSHCGYCQRSHECEQYQAYSLEGARALTVVGSQELTVDVLAKLWDKSKIVEKALESYKDAVRTYLIENKILDLGDRILCLEDVHKKEICDPIKAWGILQEMGFSDEDMAQVVKISNSATEKLVMEKAERGMKTKMKDLVFSKLDSVGAIKNSVTQKITTVKKKEK